MSADEKSDGDSESPERRRRRSSADSIPLPASTGRITTELVGPPLGFPDESSDALPVPDLEDEDLRLDPPQPESEPPRDARTIPPAPPQSGALGLVERSRGSSSGLDLVAEMRERFELDDYTGAMSAAELVLGRDTTNLEAKKISEQSRQRLEQFHLTRLGTVSARPRVLVKPSEIRWLGLDHRGGFLLSRIDGQHTVEELLEISGMPKLETLKTLVDLLQANAIALD